MKVWMLPEKLLYYFLYFCLMSFLGWIIETVYRSVREKRWVNPGFLFGPFLPIYGFGAVIITFINRELEVIPSVTAWVITLLSPTLLEYIGACVMERIFGLKLWDYRGRFLNIQGRICLRFSLYWAFCAALLITVIQPVVWTRIDIAGIYLSYFAAGCCFAYLAIDISRSARSLINFKAFRNDIAALIAKGKAYQPVFDLRFDKKMRLKLPPEILRIMRPLSSFPAVRDEFAKNLHAFPEKIKQELEQRFWHVPRERQKNIREMVKSNIFVNSHINKQRHERETSTVHTVNLYVENEKELIAHYESSARSSVTDAGANINADIIDYLLKETENTPVYNKIIINVAFPSLNTEKLNALKLLINKHIGKEISSIKIRKKRRMVSALITALIGMCFLSVKIMFPAVFSKYALNDISVIAGWVFLWRAIELLFFHPDNYKRKLKLLHLFSAEYKRSA
ncbi:MAG: putative ABC transporter permease [Spirochaetaceae bacterium]|jgi:uncharacterized membrane protein|nr:putative ABC transporter permease [Spirochaetaceae bacterium]